VGKAKKTNGGRVKRKGSMVNNGPQLSRLGGSAKSRRPWNGRSKREPVLKLVNRRQARKDKKGRKPGS